MNELKLQLGTEVHCLDGTYGKLAKIALDPYTLQVKSLLVEQESSRQIGVFPITAVQQKGTDQLALRLSNQETLAYPQLPEDNTPASRNRGENMMGNVVIVNVDTIVKNEESMRGRLASILVDPTSYDMTHIKIQQGLLFPGQVDLSSAFVQNVDAHEIFLGATDQELEQYFQAEETLDN